MPKIISEEERRLTKEAIYEETIQLIKEKGIRTITVDDIARSVGIGKGSFYIYYPSKEACLYEVIKQSEREMFFRLEGIMELDCSDKDKVASLLKEMFIAEESLVSAIDTTDVEVLLRKLPAEYRKMQEEKSGNSFLKVLQLMKLDNKQMEVVALLTDCLSYAASTQSYSYTGKKEALEFLVNAIVDYFVGKRST